MDHRVCVACKQAKPLSEFYKKSGRVGQYLSNCKPCHIRITNSNPRIRERIAEWAKRNPKRRAAHAASWRVRNPERAKQVAKNWRETHRDYINGRKVQRILIAKQQTPKWSIPFFVREARALARLRTRMTGFEWHVDHIVPLRHPLVCGLHSHTNIRVVPAVVNLRKNNHHWPDMPC